jgi:RNA polymerase sigma-70 factor, ECF subfamily
MSQHISFRAIYDDYRNIVYNLALSYVQHAPDAQDITQEVFVKVYQNLHRYDPAAASMKTWIYRITINHCLDFLKARKAKKRFGYVLGLFGSGGSGEQLIDVSGGDHPGIALEDREDLNRLFGLINALPDQQKTAIILLKIEGRPQKEVAEIMNISTKAVESLFHRGKQALSKKLTQSEGNGFVNRISKIERNE